MRRRSAGGLATLCRKYPRPPERVEHSRERAFPFESERRETPQRVSKRSGRNQEETREPRAAVAGSGCVGGILWRALKKIAITKSSTRRCVIKYVRRES